MPQLLFDRIIRIILITVAINVQQSHSLGWSTPLTARLPLSDGSFAVGSYQNSIYLLGGQNYRQLTICDISTANCSYNPVKSSVNIHGVCDYSTQIDDTIYVFETYNHALVSYNMKTDLFTSMSFYAHIPVSAEPYACLASRVGYLFVVGGSTNGNPPLKALQVLNITNNTWLTGVPSMHEARSGHTCIVDPLTNILYAIGGYVYNNSQGEIDTDTIESVLTNDFTQNQWSYFAETISISLAHISSVIHNQTIFVIGGAYGSGANMNWNYVDTVHMIDTVHMTVSVSSERLVYKVSNTAAIIVNNILYAFGGYKPDDIEGFTSINTWMVYSMTYPMPIASPSNPPTLNPTTMNPTTSPTTLNPTTLVPTTVPTTRSPQTTHPTTFIPTAIPMTWNPITNTPTITDSTALPTPLHVETTAAPTNIDKHLDTLLMTLLYICAACTGICLLGVAGVGVHCFIKRKKQQNAQTSNMNVAQAVTDADAGNVVNLGKRPVENAGKDVGQVGEDSREDSVSSSSHGLYSSHQNTMTPNCTTNPIQTNDGMKQQIEIQRTTTKGRSENVTIQWM
eukprot:496117_1